MFVPDKKLLIKRILKLFRILLVENNIHDKSELTLFQNKYSLSTLDDSTAV